MTARPSSRRLRAVVLGTLAVGLALHCWFWYAPRQRPARLDPVTVPGRLFSSSATAALWLPYPHQNVGALEKGVGDARSFVAAAAEVAGGKAPDLPAFGPFRVPPANELAAIQDAAGRFTIAARVYPAMALLARAAGKVAGNPWLCGGEVEMGGRPARVRWEGRTWIVEPIDATAPPAARAPAGTSATVPALALIHLGKAQGIVPAGLYRLTHEAGGLRLAGEAAARPPALAGLAASKAVVGWLENVQGGATAFVLVEGSGRLGLPGMASWGWGVAERRSLPGEKLLSMLASDLPRLDEEGWQGVASDTGTAEVARPLAGALEQLRGQAGRGALWVQPGPAARLADGVASALEAIPLVRRAEVRKWRAAATLLAPLAACSAVTGWVGEEEGAAELVVACSGS
ncbi:MAG TPA: hypothetical protein VF017_09290 [Thermoanaerobaculia bacterium]|nr:hypothetical protein [Thermoanaerobaculia bacterium]